MSRRFALAAAGFVALFGVIVWAYWGRGRGVETAPPTAERADAAHAQQDAFLSASVPRPVEDADRKSSGMGGQVPTESPGGSPPKWILPLRVEIVDPATSLLAVDVSWVGSDQLMNLVRNGQSADEVIKEGVCISLITAVRAGAENVGSLDRFSLGFASRQARSLRVVLPERPTLNVRLTILGPDGRPAEGAVVAAAWLGSMRVESLRQVEERDGVHRLSGIPFFLGETLRVEVNWGSNGDGGEAPTIAEFEGPPPTPAWTVPVPDDPSTPLVGEIRLKGPTGSLSDHNETDNDLPFEESLGEAPPVPEDQLGAIAVTVLLRNGKPAANVRVRCGGAPRETDSDGRVRFERISPGSLYVRIDELGVLTVGSEVVVPAGETVTVTLKEPAGGDVDVIVVDEKGRPLPYAEVLVHQRSGPWVDLEDGVQRLDPYVDHLGRRMFRRIEPGTAILTATYGSRHAHVEVVVEDGVVTPVRLVVR